jgi:flavin reductase (DIM6/NTAB) family NADH-FMN oxidoreductase RutF
MTADLAAVVAAADGAMVVVTACATDTGERDGCLVGFHVQCSIDPPRYAVWLSVRNRTHAVARRASHLGVHFLAESDHDLAALFGGITADELPDGGEGKLARVPWSEGPGGVPVLEGVTHRFVGRIVSFEEREGDHALVEVEPVEAVAPARAERAFRLADASDIDAGHSA